MTYQCPKCRCDIRTLDDEYGDHGCPCGWEPYEAYGWKVISKEAT
ncbi:hypothetical protein [Paenibacillus campinasensis]|nr:hypothetical protein [Paenibacillus campinasensis]